MQCFFHSPTDPLPVLGFIVRTYRKNTQYNSSVDDTEIIRSGPDILHAPECFAHPHRVHIFPIFSPVDRLWVCVKIGLGKMDYLERYRTLL